MFSKPIANVTPVYLGRAKRRLILTPWESMFFEKAGFQEGRDYVVEESTQNNQNRTLPWYSSSMEEMN